MATFAFSSNQNLKIIFLFALPLFSFSCYDSCNSEQNPASEYLGNEEPRSGIENLSFSMPKSEIFINEDQRKLGNWNTYDNGSPYGSGFYGQSDQQNRAAFDLYRPFDKNTGRNIGGNLPLLIFVHLGAFITGNKDDDLLTNALSEDFVRQGYATAKINYSLAIDNDNWATKLLGFIGALNTKTRKKKLFQSSIDIRNAVAFFKSHAIMYGIDPNNIYLVGYSAGAIASLNAVFFEDKEVKNWIFGNDIDEAIQFSAPPCTSVKGIVSISGALFSEPSHGMYDTNHTPLLLIQGNQDEMVPYNVDKPMQRYVKPYILKPPVTPGIDVHTKVDGVQHDYNISVNPTLTVDEDFVKSIRNFFCDDMYGSGTIANRKKDHCTLVTINDGDHYFFCDPKTGDFNQNYFTIRNHIQKFIDKNSPNLLLNPEDKQQNQENQNNQNQNNKQNTL